MESRIIGYVHTEKGKKNAGHERESEIEKKKAAEKKAFNKSGGKIWKRRVSDIN